MAGMAAGYDLSVSTISPDGRVFQVEYAAKAVDNNGLAIGVVCKDGVLLGTEKIKINKMQKKSSARRLMAVDKHIGVAVGGLLPDARKIVERAQSEAASYRDTYGEGIPPRILAERLGLFVHTFTLYWSVRPFGASLLIAAVDQEDPSKPVGELYCVEPSGTAYQYFGMALGKGKQLAKTNLEKLYLDNLSCETALFELCKIFRQCSQENKEKDTIIEFATVSFGPEIEYKLVPEDVVNENDRKAKEDLERLESA